VVGPKHRLVVIESEGRQLLLGVSGDHMALLTGQAPATPAIERPLAVNAAPQVDEGVELCALTEGGEAPADGEGPSAVQRQIEERVRGLKRFLVS
jgi:flagellar biogenesis protein FliO